MTPPFLCFFLTTTSSAPLHRIIRRVIFYFNPDPVSCIVVSTGAPVSASSAAFATLKSIFRGLRSCWSFTILNVLLLFYFYFFGVVVGVSGSYGDDNFFLKAASFISSLTFYLILVPFKVLVLNRLLANPPCVFSLKSSFFFSFRSAL